MNRNIFLNDRLLKIDVDIPISMMLVGNDIRNQENSLKLAWQWAKEKMEVSGLFGGINVLIKDYMKSYSITEQRDAAAFMVMEMGMLHRQTRKNHHFIYVGEMGIRLLNTGWGEALERHFLSDGGTVKTDYFLRGSVDLSEAGDIESVLFEEVTAILPKYSNYNDSIMQEIFNAELLNYCPYETKEKFEKKQYPFHKHGNTYSEPIQFKGDIQEY